MCRASSFFLLFCVILSGFRRRWSLYSLYLYRSTSTGAEGAARSSCTLSCMSCFICVTVPTQTVTFAHWQHTRSTPCLIPHSRTPQWFEVRQFLSRLTVPSQVLCQCIVLAVSTPTEIALSGSVTRDTIFTIFIQYYFVYIALHLVWYITYWLKFQNTTQVLYITYSLKFQ